MKHILANEEPFLLERGNESIDLMNLKILDWTELPWWLTETNNSEGIYEDVMDPNSSTYFPDYPFSYERSEPLEEDGDDYQFSSRLISIYGVRFSQTYSKDYEESSFTSELGKLVYRYFYQRPAMEFYHPIIWDIENGKVYRIKIFWQTPYKFKVLRAVDHQYDSSRIYSYPTCFDTKIYFKFRFTAEEIPSYISNPDEHDPSVWLYKINLVPVYHDTITYTSAFINEPYITQEEINTSETANANVANFIKQFENLGTATPAVASPCVYFNLGVIGNALILRNDPFLGIWPGILDLTNIPITGRFTAGINDLPIVMRGDLGEYVIIPDSNPSIIEGHTYEYNILDGVFNLIDITQTV